MPSSMFADRDDLLAHVITALPLSRARGDALFTEFQKSGYVARQENTGLSVSPRLWGGNLYGALTEVSPNAPGRVQVVMLSHPSMSDDVFDGWVSVVQGWAAGLPAQTLGAYASEIKLMKNVDDGVALTRLNKSLPPELLFTYRRKGDFVIVVDPPALAARKIYTTRNIG